MITRFGKTLALVLCTSLTLSACNSSSEKPAVSSSSSSSSLASSSVTSSSIASSAASSTSSQGLHTSLIKVNQLGFMPQSSKLAIIPNVASSHFDLIDTATNTRVFSGDLTAEKTWAPAQESVKVADFSEFNEPGNYLVRVAGVADSVKFVIAENAYQAVNAAAIKAFYFNRASFALTSEFAGVYARPLGHPDDVVLIHPSAASSARPAGTVISSPKGWYDAGDYNKYIVNSGIATYTLLAAYEHFPDYFAQQNLQIPESNNHWPDLLDEVYWNLAWMLTMQDPNDGGVYHKLTNLNFDGSVMPHKATTPRYVVQKTTAAALDFAAVMATASRVYQPYDAALASQMLTAAKQAWSWAKANPSITYKQPSDVRTGEYGDNNLSDEFTWAAAELYITSQDDQYYQAMKAEQTSASVPSWGDVKGLGWISLAHHRDHLTALADQALIVKRIKNLADNLLSTANTSAYRVSMKTGDFVWGSNSVALNQAMILIQAERLSGDNTYLKAAQSQLDYVLGRNATDFSFVTGFGTKSTMNPHHRPSEADGIAAPVPGFIAGGPQAGQQDKADCQVAYPSKIPAKSYLDHQCSYASNEIAINWNAPLVYVSAAIQVLTAE